MRTNSNIFTICCKSRDWAITRVWQRVRGKPRKYKAIVKGQVGFRYVLHGGCEHGKTDQCIEVRHHLWLVWGRPLTFSPLALGWEQWAWAEEEQFKEEGSQSLTKFWMFWADCCRGFDFTSWDGDCGTCASQFYFHVCSDHLCAPSHAPSPFSEYEDLIFGQQVCFSLHFSLLSFSTPSYALPPCAVPRAVPHGWTCPVPYPMMGTQLRHQEHSLPYGAVIPSARTRLNSHHCFFSELLFLL